MSLSKGNLMMSGRAGRRRSREMSSPVDLCLEHRWLATFAAFCGLLGYLTLLDVDGAFYSLQATPIGEGVGLSPPNERSNISTITTPLHRRKLRLDWTNLELQSELAKRLQDHQSNCSLPLATFKWKNRFGLGSDLHVWSQALCNSLEQNVRIRTPGPWNWFDEVDCDPSTANRFSSLLCYFPKAELLCEDDWKDPDLNVNIAHSVASPYSVQCESIMAEGVTVPQFRAAATEWLFRYVSPLVIQEAERQLNLVFPNGVPKNLITVQMRWGDKKKEVRLPSSNDFHKGVLRILDRRSSTTRQHDPINVFLATEDPKAVEAFRAKAPQDWNIFVDQYFVDMLPYRQQDDAYNQGPKTARETKGKAALVALGSLLVAMEANDFVLMTASNWSRLMNELRKNVLDPRCDSCTLLEDVKYGEW